MNYSRMSLTSILEEIVHLSPADRAKLIDVLWESLDEDRVKEVEARCASESAELLGPADRGELQTTDGPSSFQDISFNT